MQNRRGAYLHILRLCLGLIFICLISSDSFARQIALFYDPLYVDVNEGNVFAEASNLKASLELLGHDVMIYSDFDSILGREFDLVIIPELEKQDLAQSLSAEQLDTYREYVDDGGAIIIMGVVSSSEFQGENAISFINKMIGSNMQIGPPILEGTCIKDSNIQSGDFSTAPDEINNNNAVVYIQSNFAVDSNILYSNESNPSEAAVAEFEYGKGSLMYFGWGWWNAMPYGSQDGGWLSLLDISVETLSCDQPEMFLDNRYQFTLELNGEYNLEKAVFENQYTACTETEISFSKSNFTCEDINKEILIEVRLKDELERETTQNIIVFIEDLHDVCALQPLQQQLTGSIQAMNGSPLQDVEVILEAEIPLYLNTDENGLILTPVLDREEYFVMIHKEAFIAKEVTTNDLLLLQRHILGYELFTSPYQYLAADLNGDKKLDIEDMTLLRKLILNHNTEGAIPANWLWLDKNYSFDNGTRNPLLEMWDTIHDNALDMENLHLQLLGIKIGDIDASYRD